MTVNNGGTLGGAGEVGNVTVTSGGTLAPGNSPEILDTGNLSLQSGATLDIELGGTTVGTQYDQVTCDRHGFARWRDAGYHADQQL